MVISLDRYKVIKPFVQAMVKNNPNADHHDLVSRISQSSNVPLIVCCFYYIREIGYSPPEILKLIQTLKEFYGYTEIKESEESKS
jgi:hypothetical protein